jgi:Raf kinase inhibitor-like YbhB/YbcL family protein
MRRLRLAAAVLFLAGPAAAAKPRRAPRRTAMSFTLTSPAFENGAVIPKAHTCDGEDSSPTLRWSGWPEGTKSFALIMDDPDAPMGTWIHWVIYDLPAGRRDIAGGLAKTGEVLDGAKQGACWGVDSFERVGYHGPCPPPGWPHHYHFKLYALKKTLGLPASATKAEVLAAMKGAVLAETELVGVYERKK